jgi:hypothetical protein
MLPENRRDLGTGIVLLLLGVWIAVYALTHYRLGELSRIGSAAYPAGVGALLALLGLIIAASAWFRPGPTERAPLRPILMVLGSIVAFALLVDWVGLFPAVIVLVGGAILADNQHSWASAVKLTVLAAVGVWVIFGLILGMSFTILRWPL